MLCVPKHPNRHPQAFTLIEVVIALAVAGFSLVAILGLFSTGINADTSSSRSTTLANMAMQVTAQMRGNTNWTTSVGPNYFYSTDFYFDHQGNPVPTAQAATAFYDCRLSLSNTNQPPLGSPASTNFVAVKMNFVWPYSANLAHPYSTNVYSSVSP